MKSPNFQLSLQTSNLVIGFMVWVILSSLMPYIKADIPLTAGQISMVTAVPVILGSILRIPIGYWTNRYGARKLFFISFILLLFPVFYISVANSMMDLIIGGLFVGIGGAVFSVGVTSLPKYFPKESHGFVNGIYGVGNAGTAITSFLAPVIATSVGWRTTVQCYLVLLAAFALMNFLLGDRKEKKVNTPLMEQIKGVYKNEKLWFLCIFYFLTFG
ncbi:MFS transporter, partial [Bacillus toyonensis]